MSFIEQHSIDYVPLAERHGKVWHLWPVWFSGDAHLATIATGVVGIALGGSFAWMALAVVLGCAFGTFFMAFHSTQGPQLGLPQMIQSRPQFGYVGALLVWGVALIAYIGYNAFNQVLAAQTAHALLGLESGPTMLVFTLLSLALAVVGYDLIHLAQRWIAYILIVALLVFTAVVAVKAPLSVTPEWRDFRAVSFLAQFFAAASYQISWSIYVSDYSRYLPRNVGVSASFWWTYLGAFVGGSWTMLVGTIVAALNPTQEVAQALQTGADGLLPVVPVDADGAAQEVDVATLQTHQIWQARAGVGSIYYPLDQSYSAGTHGDQMFWSADDRIAFVWEGDGWRHLYAVPAFGGAATLLTPGDGEVETAALTADGSNGHLFVNGADAISGGSAFAWCSGD